MNKDGLADSFDGVVIDDQRLTQKYESLQAMAK